MSETSIWRRSTRAGDPTSRPLEQARLSSQRRRSGPQIMDPSCGAWSVGPQDLTTLSGATLLRRLASTSKPCNLLTAWAGSDRAPRNTTGTVTPCRCSLINRSRLDSFSRTTMTSTSTASRTAAEQCAAIAETPDDEALPRQLVGQGLAVDRVAIEEKDANGIHLADRAMQPPRSVPRSYDILFKHRRHMKPHSSFALYSSTGRVRQSAPRPAARQPCRAPTQSVPPR